MQTVTGLAADELHAGAAALGCVLAGTQIDALLAYRDLLLRWNRVHNLTAVRDPAQVLAQHLFDCLAVVTPLRRELLRAGGQRHVLDVGSGGGLPGVVLAVAAPELQVVCVDAVAKKAGFVQQVAAELRLPNLRSLHVRVEQLAEPAPFDAITARAFASLADFVTLSRRSLAPHGVWMAMKGQRPQAEIDALPPGVEVFHVEPLQVPGLVAERCLVWMRPAALAPGR